MVDNGPVIQWLQSLGLSKYKDVIVKEEIDWETLQSLTEEVRDVYLFNFSFSLCMIFKMSLVFVQIYNTLLLYQGSDFTKTINLLLFLCWRNYYLTELSQMFAFSQVYQAIWMF